MAKSIAGFSSPVATMVPAQTGYFALRQTYISEETTETAFQSICKTDATLSSFGVYSSLNTLSTASTTCTVRVNEADGNQTISISAGVTGHFLDDSNTDDIVEDDSYGMETVVDAGGSGTVFITRGVITYDADDTTTTTFGSHDPGANNTGTTQFSICGEINPSGGVIARMQGLMRSEMTIRNLRIYISVNSRTTSTDFKSNINGSDGNQTMSISSTSTGWFEDNSNTDSISDGDLLTTQQVCAVGSGTITTTMINLDGDSEGRITELFAFDVDVASAGSVEHNNIYGGLVATGGEAASQTSVYLEALFSNSRQYIDANTATGDGTVVFRIDLADGNQIFSITALTTGWFEDTTNTDRVSYGEKVNWKRTNGTGGTTTYYANGVTMQELPVKSQGFVG